MIDHIESARAFTGFADLGRVAIQRKMDLTAITGFQVSAMMRTMLGLKDSLLRLVAALFFLQTCQAEVFSGPLVSSMPPVARFVWRLQVSHVAPHKGRPEH